MLAHSQPLKLFHFTQFYGDYLFFPLFAMRETVDMSFLSSEGLVILWNSVALVVLHLSSLMGSKILVL